MPDTEIATRQPQSQLEVLIDQTQKLRPHLHQLGIEPARFIRIVTNELQRNAELQKCTPSSLFAAVLRSAELNLEPGPLGLAWFIPRRIKGTDQVTWQLGYKGIVELAARAGITIQTGVVHEGEHFIETLGTSASIEHRPHPNPTGPAIAYYAVATLPDGRKLHRVLSRDEIEKRRKAGRTEMKPGSAWGDWYESMARKTAILAMKSMLPMSAEMHRAFDADDQVLKVGLTGIEPVRSSAPQLTAAGERVDIDTGEIQSVGEAVSGPGADSATAGLTQDVAAASPASHSALGEGERSQAPQAAAVDATPEPEPQATGSGVGPATDARPAPPMESDPFLTSEQAPAATPPHEANAAQPDQPAPARPSTSNQRQVLVLMSQELGHPSREDRLARASMALGIEIASFKDLLFEQATTLIRTWAPQVESWRINRRSRLASAAENRKINLPHLLEERHLPLAGELSARQCQTLIDELEAEQLPVSQPSLEEAVSAPAADSTSQDGNVRVDFDTLLVAVKAGEKARRSWRDSILERLGLESLDDLTTEQLHGEIALLRQIAGDA